MHWADSFFSWHKFTVYRCQAACDNAELWSIVYSIAAKLLGLSSSIHISTSSMTLNCWYLIPEARVEWRTLCVQNDREHQLERERERAALKCEIRICNSLERGAYLSHGRLPETETKTTRTRSITFRISFAISLLHSLCLVSRLKAAQKNIISHCPHDSCIPRSS